MLASGYGQPVTVFIGRLRMPTLHSGPHTNRKDKIDLSAVDGFVRDLNALIECIPFEVFKEEGARPIKLADTRVLLYRGRGEQSIRARSFLSRAENELRIAVPETPGTKERDGRRYYDSRRATALSLAHMRTEAELLRFLAITGMNLQPALELCAADLTYVSIFDEYLVRGLKNRGNVDLEVRVPKWYRSRLDDWLSFRARLFPWGDVKALFPFFGRDASFEFLGGERSMSRIRGVFSKIKRPFFLPRDLRFAHAQRSLQNARSSAGLGQVASGLGHTLPTLVRSYLRPGQSSAVKELVPAVRALAAKKVRHSVPVGGGCVHPRRPEAIERLLEEIPKPDCSNPAGCLFCVHYRAVATVDATHALLSYRHLLQLRASAAPICDRDWRSVVQPTIERVNDAIETIRSGEGAGPDAIQQAEALIARAKYHASWQGWIEIESIRSSDAA
jgi:hypothetical protein